MEHFDGFLEACPDAVLIVDRGGIIKRANRNVQPVLGYEPATLEGMPVETLVDEEDRAAHREYRETYMADPEPRPMGRDLDLYARRQDGTSVPVEIGLGPVQVDGEAHVAATISDVSARKERIERLRESEQRYRRLLDSSPAAIVIYDDEGVLAYANEAAAELVGQPSPADLVGESVQEFIHPEDRETSVASVRRVLEDRERVEGAERRLVTVDGETRQVMLSTVPITYDGEPAGQVLLQDVTTLKQRERELERQNERLDRFASIVSHDLRNPLTVLSSSLELAAETGDVEDFERAQRALDRMERLLEDLLRIARQGNAPTETEQVAVAEVARDAWSTVETTGAELALEADGTVEAEPSRLRTIFENLFRNAIEHAADGDDGPLSIRVAEREDGFVVADDGVGIPDGERETVFEWGYSTSETGTGFGLAIVEEVAEAHDWSVSLAESDAGGARFEVRTD